MILRTGLLILTVFGSSAWALEKSDSAQTYGLGWLECKEYSIAHQATLESERIPDLLRSSINVVERLRTLQRYFEKRAIATSSRADKERYQGWALALYKTKPNGSTDEDLEKTVLNFQNIFTSTRASYESTKYSVEEWAKGFATGFLAATHLKFVNKAEADDFVKNMTEICSENPSQNIHEVVTYLMQRSVQKAARP